ncbi:MAG: hypothetical protein ABFC96_10550 [Thermoguttaceae bacterium]
MRSRAVITLAVFALAISAVAAAQPQGTARLHPWGRFEPGSWKVVRVVTETLNEQGQVVSTSTADTRTTLLGLDGDGVTLEVQACVEVAGKRFQAERQTVKQDFFSEPAGPSLTVSEPADTQILVEGRKIACKVYQLETVDGREKMATSVYCSTAIPPYVLKREAVTTGADGKTVLSETGVEIVALDMPVRVRGETRSGSYVKTVHKNGKGTVTTLAVVLPDVPGGVVSHNSKEIDPNGRVIRRSTLELLDYNAEPERPANRRRASRRAK